MAPSGGDETFPSWFRLVKEGRVERRVARFGLETARFPPKKPESWLLWGKKAMPLDAKPTRRERYGETTNYKLVSPTPLFRATRRRDPSGWPGPGETSRPTRRPAPLTGASEAKRRVELPLPAHRWRGLSLFPVWRDVSQVDRR